MRLDPIEACKQAGFAEAFLLPNASYSDWARHQKDGAFHSNTDFLRRDPVTAYSWANACLIAVWAYTPFDDPSIVPAYYLASNHSYHVLNALLETFRAEGIRAERAETPYRTQLLQAGIGTRMDNQLWYYPPYGTYTVLWGVMLAMPEPVTYSKPQGNAPVCDHCGRCDRVCCGALQGGTFDWHECIRSYLENVSLPERFLPRLESFSGCERCQMVCPKNPTQRISVPETVRTALDPVEIVRGNSKAALSFLGKNRKKPLMRQAIVLCGNRGRSEVLPLLRQMRDEGDGNYDVELNYAIKLLQNGENMIE